MPATPAPPFHVGLTPERIVEVALQLTEEQHLFGWSIRDLARGLDVAPSVIYHHVGGKDLLCRRVVERVGAGSPGVTALAEMLIAPLSRESELTEPQHQRYFRFIVDTTIAGVEHLLAEQPTWAE